MAIDPFVTGGSTRVIRGGGWSVYSSRCRSAIRDANGPGSTSNGVGFRVVLAPILVP
jgi:formylglycine-generating enzyme required for sulfatase activity